MRRFHTALLSGVLTCAVAASNAFAQSAVTAYENARLIDGRGGAPVETATVIVEGSRILAAGPSSTVRTPDGARRVDLAGKTIMPMVIDTHVHLSPSRDALIRDLKRRAYFGVGAALSMGTDPVASLPVRGETIVSAARFLSAGRGITMPEPGRITAPHWIETVAEGRKVVEELAGHKVDIVKIWVDNRGGKYKKLTPEIYGAIIEEAHRRGLRVAAHIFDLEDGKGLIRAGVDSLAHGVRDKDIDDEMVELFKKTPNLVLIPNLPERGVVADLSWLQSILPADEWQKLEDANRERADAQVFFGIQSRNLRRLNAAGARIVLGTDGNRPWAAHDEMADMVLSGMTAMQVIVAATRNSAEFLRLADTGTLEAGNSADFIVLDANPLENIANTRRISAVYLRGAAVDRSAYP